jgi:predicted nucleic acid-binding protein
MTSLFLDASVLFAAAYSSRGASRELMRLALRGDVNLSVSRFVLEETVRNLSAKASPEISATFQQLIAALDLEITPDPSKEDVLAAAAYTALKDAPVVAAAINAQTDYLVTLDRKHLIDPVEVAGGSGLAIVLPSDALAAVREELGDNMSGE